MPEAEILYSDIKFSKPKGGVNVASPSATETTYSEVNIVKTQGSAGLQGSKQSAASNRRSGVTAERVALLVLSVLLAAAVIALGLTLHKNTETQKSLQEPGDKCEAKYISGETSPRCKDGWEEHGGKCYFFTSYTYSWNESRKLCRELRADLVVINSREEQTFLLNKLMKKMNNPEDKFWIGLTDSATETTWLWVDESKLDQSLAFFLDKEPDNWTGEDPDGEDCVRMGEKTFPPDLKSWVDKSCKSPHKSICEKPQKRSTQL